MAHDVFISYAVEDKPTADAVCATLEARQIRCWIAPRDVLPGEGYAEALIGAIHESRLLVLVFSSSANQSPHVVRELERAASRGIPILPLRIEDVPLSPSLEYFISRTHWLDALTPPFERHLQQLAETVRLLLTRARRAAQVGGELEAPAPARPAEAALDRGLGRPPPSGRAFEVAMRWAGRPMVRIALGIGAIGAVTIIVLVALLSGGGDGGFSSFVLSPTPTEGGPTVAPSSPTVPPSTPTTTPTPPVTPDGSQLTLADAPYYLDAGGVLPGFTQLDPHQEGLSNQDLGLGPLFSEVVVFLSEEPFQLTYMAMAVASGEIEKAAAKAELRDEQALEEAFLLGVSEAIGAEGVETTIRWSDPAVGDVAKLASFTANFEGAEVQFELFIFYQEEGREAAEVFIFSLWLSGEPPTVDTLTIAQEISARIANR